MLERTERGITLSGVGGFTRAAHMQNHPGKREDLSHVDDAFQLVHGLNAAHPFHLCYRERAATFAVHAEIAASRRMQGIKLETVVGERLCDGSHFGICRVIKMTASREDFQGLEASMMDLRQQFRREFLRNEKIGRENSLHKVSV